MHDSTDTKLDMYGNIDTAYYVAIAKELRGEYTIGIFKAVFKSISRVMVAILSIEMPIFPSRLAHS
ncbi:hypothetical protein [Neptunomonas antarctica]|uniref:Uncharacterized protein n=1 Tax=Neptunomonas antarctica TaxID=619304 RepID=A0A1N7N5D2_9GAMM|nr:hypothetical protein [Neptunomonas antarctica]SIS93554.1 hypothetical protein SAMN05421760_10864 [Neptunomonas antarctica]